MTAFSYTNGKNFCVRNKNYSLWSRSCFDYEMQQWWRIFYWEEITRFSMIKRLLEAGMHYNMVWLLIKHIFVHIPVYTGPALGKKKKKESLSFIFSWCNISTFPCWPRNNVRIKVWCQCHKTNPCFKTSRRKYLLNHLVSFLKHSLLYIVFYT